MAPLPKLIVITGPTSSGKTDLSIRLAQKFNGEIVSADSRQVYKGMDIGSGKVTPEEMQGIPHHLLDVANPADRFTLADYLPLALHAIDDIIARGKTPFLVGGTPLYIQAIVDNYILPPSQEDPALRAQREAQPLATLVRELKEKDPTAHQRIDLNNKIRVIRALETTSERSNGTEHNKQGEPRYNILMIAPDISREELYRKADQRVDDRIQQGMIQEVEKLMGAGVPNERLYGFGQEYRFCFEYIEGEWESEEEMVRHLKYAIHSFVRRQMTWFRKEPRIHWITSIKEAEKLINDFLK